MIEKIPIDEAVQAGSWLTCENDDCRLKIRLDGFREVTTEAIAAPARMQGKDNRQAKAVILYLTVINACNNMLVYQLLQKILRVIDSRGCDYRSIEPGEDILVEQGFPDKLLLQPEEEAKGQLTFILPQRSNEYYFGIVEGSIQEEPV